MRLRPRTRGVAATLIVGALLLARAADSRGQAGSPPTPAAKAAFLFNFARFVEWPIDAMSPTQRITLCVVGDNAVADALAQLVKGQTIDEHLLDAHATQRDGPLRSCHRVYVGALDDDTVMDVLETLKGAPVFTVGDCDRFADAGGIVQLVNEHGRLRFVINLIAAHQARLTLSSQLLGLAKTVKG